MRTKGASLEHGLPRWIDRLLPVDKRIAAGHRTAATTYRLNLFGRWRLEWTIVQERVDD